MQEELDHAIHEKEDILQRSFKKVKQMEQDQESKHYIVINIDLIKVSRLNDQVDQLKDKEYTLENKLTELNTNVIK